jgi:uncharacterized protein DUF4054
MPFTIPSAAAFKVRFPEFEEQDNTLVQNMIQAAADEGVDATLWMEKYYQIGILLLAAHYLSLHLEQERIAAQQATGSGSGAGSDLQTFTNKIKFEGHEVSFGSSKSTNVTVGGGGGVKVTSDPFFDQTIYGQQFYRLRRRNIVAAAII